MSDFQVAYDAVNEAANLRERAEKAERMEQLVGKQASELRGRLATLRIQAGRVIDARRKNPKLKLPMELEIAIHELSKLHDQ